MGKIDKEERIRIIRENHHLNNSKIANILGMKENTLRVFMGRNDIRRTDDVREKLIREGRSKGGKRSHELHDRNGSNNPNWKGGISKNHYHYKKIQMQRYPERIRAREKLHYAVKTGKLIRQPCEVCSELPSFAHHEDYNNPLDVNWFCRNHHREKHNNKH